MEPVTIKKELNDYLDGLLKRIDNFMIGMPEEGKFLFYSRFLNKYDNEIQRIFKKYLKKDKTCQNVPNAK